MHHGKVDLAGDDLARPDRLAAGGTGDDLLGESHTHSHIPK
jgi:hypothetical protein